MFKDTLAMLEKVRAEQGEEAYQGLAEAVAPILLLAPSGEEVLRQAFPSLDIEEVKKKTANMRSVLRLHLPDLQTDFQLELYITASDLLVKTMNEAFAGRFDQYKKHRDMLEEVFHLAEMERDLAAKVEEIPEEKRSPKASSMVGPPEAAILKDLLTELEQVTSTNELNDWYRKRRVRMDAVTTASNRNTLFDTIRSKRGSFSN